MDSLASPSDRRLAPWLHYTPAMARQRGFTLVELMIVVAIIGVLAGISVYAYGRYLKKARASEVPEVFGSFQMAEEAFNAENGVYLGAAGGEDDFHPAALVANDRQLVDPRPAYWTQLRLRLAKRALYCQYSASAGVAGDATNVGAIGAPLYNNVPPTSDWFYLKAQCDFDASNALNATFAQRGDQSAIVKQNEGL